MLFKLSNLDSNLPLTLGYLNPALNNSALGLSITQATQELKTNISENRETMGRGLMVDKPYCTSGDSLRPCFPN